ncbi:MAG: DOMON-like domain-containing protein [Deltaproteobacteria bacterium]|nr:DOMON-like domain-containing protein [Deltaproteobacteria bacterium]
MKSRNFSLKPFSGTGSPPFKITGSFFRRDQTLGLTYHLLGRIRDIEVPPPADRPSRRIGLWEDTCFEFFIGPRDSTRYWEFNLSPSGNWNVFRFETYRQGLFEEKAFSSLPFKSRIQLDSLRVDLEIDLSIMIPAVQPLEMAVSTVLKTSAGDLSLWAVTHPGPAVDFHHRDGFIIKL